MDSKKLAVVVIIHGYNAKKTAVYNELPMELNRTITFIGRYGIPVIMAKKGTLLTTVSFCCQSIAVMFMNITFQGSSYGHVDNDLRVFIVLRNFYFYMDRCSFVSVPRPLHLKCFDIKCYSIMKDSKIFSPIIGLLIEGNGQIFASIERTEFIGKQDLSKEALTHQRMFNGTIADIFRLRIFACKFMHFKTALLVFTAANICSITIQSSTFQNNSLIQKFRYGSTSSSVSVMPSRLAKAKTKFSIIVHACHFLNNYATEGSGIALRFNGQEFKGDIKNCTFKDNHASTTGGAVSFYNELAQRSHLNIYWSIFENNSVGNTNFLLYDPYYSRTYGSGGALSFAARETFISSSIGVFSCTFIANSAAITGGTIYAFLKYILLENLKIITPRNSPKSLTDGTVISIQGWGMFSDVEITVKDDYLSQKSAVYLAGQFHVTKSATLTCPVGTVIQQTAYEDSTSFSFFSLSCILCAIDEYNLHGSTFSNLSIERPNCWKCPPGAICQNGRLKPVDNYWGNVDDKHGNLSLIQLPVGYGCSKKQCKRYDSCADNRHGTLCSTCMKGYSESMFSSKCVKDEYCHSRSFWAMVIPMIIFYPIFFIYKKNLICFLKNQLLWFRRVDKRRSNEFSMNRDHYVPFMEEIATEIQTRNPRDDNNLSESQSDSSAGLLKIIFYFYQIEALLDIYGGKIEHDMVKGIKSIVQSILSFNFLESSGSSTCAMNDATPVIKVMLRGLFVAAVLTAFILLYVIYKVLQRRKEICCKTSSERNTKHAFGYRVLAALFEVLLLSYAVITKIITSMLDCRTIGDKKVLFLQGNVFCYQSWRYGIATAGLAWVVPFCIYINLLPNFIRSKEVSTKGFFLGCIFPIPVIVYYAVKKNRGNNGLEDQQQTSGYEGQGEENAISAEQEACGSALDSVRGNENGLIPIIQGILCGPFKDKINSSKYLSWDGVYIFRRLCIVSVFVFVEDATYKLYVLLVVQILILMHQSHVRPYKSKVLNWLESASLGFLVLINGMNLFIVYDFAHGILEVGDKLLLLKIFAWIETVLHLLVPTLIITSLAVLLVVRCFYVMFKILRFCIRVVMRLVIQCVS